MASGELTLADLWQTGKQVEFVAPEGTVTVWVKKITPAEMDEVFRKAKAKRAVAITMSRDTEGDTHQAAVCDAYDVGDHADLVQWILDDEFLIGGPRMIKASAEQAGRPEWSDEGYLTGLYEAWSDGLSRVWAEDPEDAEAARVFAEMTRFDEQVRAQLDATREDLRSDWDQQTDDQLREEVAARIVKAGVEEAFVAEYRRAEIWKGTCSAGDHSVKIFKTRGDVDLLSVEALGILQGAFARLAIGAVEGKGSPVDPASSPSSEQPAEPETAASSGLVTASP